MPGFIGMPELLLLGLVALLLFGPKRLPEMGRGLGKGMREFKDSVTGITDSTAPPAEPKQIEPAAPPSDSIR
jgi:sec-independent protein translocase protein TatA